MRNVPPLERVSLLPLENAFLKVANKTGLRYLKEALSVWDI